MTPHPTRAEASVDPELVTQRRRLGCANETACLDVATRARWPALSCEDCRAFVSISRERRYRDMGPLVALALWCNLPVARAALVVEAALMESQE